MSFLLLYQFKIVCLLAPTMLFTGRGQLRQMLLDFVY